MRCRSAKALLIALVSFAAFVPTALANEPDRQVTTPTNDVYGPGELCPASLEPAGVWVHNTGPTSVLRTWDNGRQLFTGRHPGEFTNLATGQSLDLRLQGSANGVPLADGGFELRLSGSTVFEFFPGDVGPGDQSTPRVYAFTGDVKLLFDPNGAVIGFTSSGSTEDVCAAIA